MTWLIVTLACGTPDPVAPTASLPEPAVVAKAPATPADWTALLDIASSISHHWAANTIRQKPPRTRLVIDDAAVGRARTLILRKQREVPMPVDDDTAHWLVETEDADTAEVVVLDYTVDWTPPPPDAELPGLSYTAVAVEIQAVAGIERYTWAQDGARWVRQGAAVPAATGEAHPSVATPEVDVVSLRAHADMLSRIVTSQPGDAAWLDDLQALASAGGTVAFLIGTPTADIGWRVEGSTVAFRDAMSAVADRRVGAARARESASWLAEPPYAVEVVVGPSGWVRFDSGTTATGARGRLSAVTPLRELDQVLDGATTAQELWTGVWTSADGRSGYSVATRSRPGEVQVILDAPSVLGEEPAIDATRWIPGGDELVCVDALSKAGSRGHGARLGKATSELSVHDCDGIRERGFGDARVWFVELSAP